MSPATRPRILSRTVQGVPHETTGSPPFKPARYVVCRSVDDSAVDGDLSETRWANAAWTATFGHISMTGYRKTFLTTRAKPVRDDHYLSFTSFTSFTYEMERRDHRRPSGENKI